MLVVHKRSSFFLPNLHVLEEIHNVPVLPGLFFCIFGLLSHTSRFSIVYYRRSSLIRLYCRNKYGRVRTTYYRYMKSQISRQNPASFFPRIYYFPSQWQQLIHANLIDNLSAVFTPTWRSSQNYANDASAVTRSIDRPIDQHSVVLARARAHEGINLPAGRQTGISSGHCCLWHFIRSGRGPSR